MPTDELSLLPLAIAESSGLAPATLTGVASPPAPGYRDPPLATWLEPALAPPLIEIAAKDGALQRNTAMAPRVDTPRRPLPRWINWAVGFNVVSLSVDAVCVAPGDRRHDAPLNTVVRGLIGKRLRDLRCLTQAATCTGCHEASRCDYATVFDRRLTATESDSEGDEVPPFWLQGLPADRALAQGAQLSIRLHVTGPAVGVLPYLDVAYRDALVHVGLRPSASVVHSTDLRTLTHEPITKTLRIIARSPLRLRGDMSRSRRDCPAVPWFAQLVRSGVRRLDRLRMAFGEPGDRPYLEMPALDDVEVVSGQGDSMQSWRDTRKGVPLTGLMGSAVVAGEGVRRLVPLLRVLTITNVGKATTMGFGDLAIEELPDTRRLDRPLDTATPASDDTSWPLATE